MSTSGREGSCVERNMDQRKEDGFRDMIKAKVSWALLQELPSLVTRISARLIVRLRERDTPSKVVAQATTEEGNQRPMRRRWATRTKPAATTNVPGDVDRGKRKCDDEETPYLDPYRRCFNFKKMGHLVKECPEPRVDGEDSSKGVIQLMGDVLSYDMCGEYGHKRKNCIF
ncbi:hypothetical protein LXL04_023414 [Taraxacum kok-saghyz]